MSTEVVIAFLIGLIVGLLVAWWYWRRRMGECEAQIQTWRSRAQDADAKTRQLETQLKEREQQWAAQQAAAAPSRAAAPAIKPDKLERIEGIGPKISQVLQNAGILTFAQLAATDVGRLEQILRDAELPLADPATWPDQARLAAAGDWSGLEKLQGELKGGRRV